LMMERDTWTKSPLHMTPQYVTVNTVLESRWNFELVSRLATPRRGAVGLIALLACGFGAPTALASPSPDPPAASKPAASAEGEIAMARPLTPPPDPGTTVAAAPPTADPSGATSAAAPPTDSQPATPTDTGESVPAAPAAASPVAPAPAATTDQSAGSAATATQQQPTNVVVIIRVNSAGDDGPISQKNITVATPSSANDASTAQSGPGGTAATTQQATATATSTQDNAGNLVVTVRIDSPGRDGAVAQTNGVVGASSATNASGTTQQEPAPSAAVQPQARRGGAGNSAQRPARPHPKQTSAASAPVKSSAPAAGTDVEPTTATLDRVVVQPRPVHRHPVETRQSSGNKHRGAMLNGIAAATKQVLSPFLPQAPPVATAARPEDVSRSVLFTLLALVAAAAAVVGGRRVPVWRRASSRRSSR
jgi:hypothetical protein